MLHSIRENSTRESSGHGRTVEGSAEDIVKRRRRRRVLRINQFPGHFHKRASTERKKEPDRKYYQILFIVHTKIKNKKDSILSFSQHDEEETQTDFHQWKVHSWEILVSVADGRSRVWGGKICSRQRVRVFRNRLKRLSRERAEKWERKFGVRLEASFGSWARESKIRACCRRFPCLIE